MLLPTLDRCEAAVKEQYVGDVSDYRKYALLRALAAAGVNRVGVAWMLTPSDSSADGNKLAYLGQPEKHRRFDPELFDLLKYVATEPNRRRLHSIEDGGAVPGARFFNAPLTDDAAERRGYMANCLAAFADVDLVFFDPDNGLPRKRLAIGHKGSAKFIFSEEVRAFYDSGKSVLIYQHFARVEREAFIAACATRLREVAPDARVWAFRTPDMVFLLLLRPDAKPPLKAAVHDAATRWEPSFMIGRGVLASEIASADPNAADEAFADAGEASEAAGPTLPEVKEPTSSQPSLLRRIFGRLR